MKVTKYLAITIALLTTIMVGCKKTDFDDTVNGEALGEFRLTSPTSGSNLILNSATPNAPVTISWTAAKPGVNTQPTYKWVVARKQGGSLEQPLFEIASGNAGKATSLTLTYRQIDSILNAKGIAANASTEFIWNIVADNGSTKQASPETFTVTIKRMGDGVTPFVLYGPASSTTNLEINPSSSTDFINFKWQKSVPGVAANTVKYRVVFYNEGSTTPLFSINSGSSGSDTTLSMSWQQLSDSLTAKGLTDFSQVAKLDWTVVATSGNFSMAADYINKLYIVRLVRMYMVGNITGWDINNPWELIGDKAPGRLGKVFYTYVQVPVGGAQFLFVKEKGNWGSKYGITGGAAPTYDIGYNAGGDFTIATPGIYRLTIDVGTMKAHIQQKQVGLVGGMQGWNPGSPLYGGLAGRDRFIIIADVPTNEIFKYHDGPVWDNSAPDKARWWGKGANAGTLDNDGNGDNISNNTGATRIRAIWDGTNPQQLKYELYAAAEMRVVGDGMQGVNAWDPGSSPQMTYLGNGRWQITLTLIAGKDIKFLAGNAWNAFDYEDNSGGSTATGTPRSIKWDGGGNFKTPAVTGSYTITLDEYAQTVTIN